MYLIAISMVKVVLSMCTLLQPTDTIKVGDAECFLLVVLSVQHFPSRIEDAILALKCNLRYRIFGSALLTAMDQSSVASPLDMASSHLDNEEQDGRSKAYANREKFIKSSDYFSYPSR
ncbi:hypothetical protein FXO37_25416 [Capsicum annuum]|nr:hypothetical protein FXO37_25416 [Capsicum annuum]